jgi:hypothetical protein
MAKTAGALADVEAAVLAEIVAPGIGAANEPGLVAPSELLRADRDGDPYQRKTDLRIGCIVGATGRPARSGLRDNVPARPISEIG